MSNLLQEKQLAIEQTAEGKASAKYLKDLTAAISQGRFDDTKEGQALMKTIFIPIRDKITEYFGTKYRGHTEKTRNYIKLLSDDPNELTYTLISTLVSSIAKNNNSVHLTTLAKGITKRLKKLHYFSRLKRDNPKLHSYLGTEYRRASAKRKEMLMEKHITSLYSLEETGDSVNEVKIGTQLIEIVMNSGIDILVQTRRHTRRKKPAYFISFTDEVLDILYNINTRILPSPVMQPMIVEPKDWTAINDGGYLSYQIPLVKSRTGLAKKFLKDQDFSKVIPIINKLQKTSWRINKRVADIIHDVFEKNMIDPTSPPTLPRCYGGIPTANLPTIENLIGRVEYKEKYTEAEKEAWKIWNKKREHIRIGLDGEVGRRLQFILTMNMMQDMIDYERFYYVYQLDYRGRVYPHTDFLNPQSKGYTKAMLEFADGEYLDDEGIKWLKIHTANCWGLDKEPFSDRIKWAEENRTELLEVAKDPMGTLKYWTTADSPYEFLAACYAYEDHIRGEKVHLPIQLDAVNSGVQFYSGLLLDKDGAESCCVIGSKRSDLYQLVANRVNKKLTDGDYPKIINFTDGEGKERTISSRTEAESLTGKVTRSMTKTNVMTVPYSVTMRGMKQQNWDVMDKMKLEGKEFWKGDEWVVNYLLTELNYQAIFELINGARQGQDYLREVSKLLTRPAVWHTPLYSFPVMQPAFKQKEIRIKTPLGRLSVQVGINELDRGKQLSSIAANYIHSIDSTLLLYCVENMSSNIGVIHDCYLVHPNRGEEIRHHYKEGYIKIMESRPLETLSKELDPDGNIEVPCIGTLNLEEVRDSEYIIS